MIDCETARRALIEQRGPAAASAEQAEARPHLRSCQDCREWQQRNDAWRAALKEKLPGLEPPLAVKERLFAALAHARAGADLRLQRRRWTLAFAALAFAGLGLGGFFWWREATRDGILVAALTEDHLLYDSNPSPAEFASPDPLAVARWFAGKVDFAVSPPPLAGGELLGGRLCTLADRRAALWIYARDGARLSLFQMPAGGLPLGRMRSMTVGGRRYLCAHRKGLSVLAWTERDVLFALVSALPEDDMLRLVRS